MNNKAVVALCVAAFFIGDAEGIIRNNVKIKKLNSKLHRAGLEICHLRMRANTLIELINASDVMCTDEAKERFNEKSDFLEIIWAMV